MTQFQLAEYLHVTQQTVNRYEIGESESSYEVLNNIKNIFNVSAKYLIDDSTDLDAYKVEHKILLDTKEENWIKIFRKLDKKSRELVIKLCRISKSMANQILSCSNKIFSIVHAMLKAFVYVAKKETSYLLCLFQKRYTDILP